MPAPRARACVTLDLHDVDLPKDIAAAADWLTQAGVSATWFVPSALLASPAHAGVLRQLPSRGHELASHSHHHDRAEIDALVHGRTGLSFLERSRDLHGACFGTAPVSFRAPHWIVPSRTAFEALAELGYRVDSSATPSRLPVFSSQPYRSGWLFAPRSVTRLAQGLLEIPTSCLLLPAGAPTFLTLREASHAFVELLVEEARCRAGRVVVIQLHVEDLVQESRRDRSPGRFTARDLWLRPQGGFGFKWFLRERDPIRICRVQRALVARLAREDVRTLAAWEAAWPARGLAPAPAAAWQAPAA